MTDPVALTARLVEAKSYSGEEDAAADVVAAALREAGLEPRRVERNVWAAKGTGERALLFNSHLDTVPSGPGWTRDPWKAEVVDGKLFGLGANDAKSCVAAMLAAFIDAKDPGERGRLVFCASAEEEGPGPRTAPGEGCRGLEVVIPHLGKLAGAVVGEPTALAICAGQRGRALLRLVCEGKAGHASRPHEGVNAIDMAGFALELLRSMRIGHLADPLLGKPTICPTLIEGGTKSNVIPARCSITLDCRTTPRWNNDEARREVDSISGHEPGENGPRRSYRVETLNARFTPCITPSDAPILAAARRALPDSPVRAMQGVSDLFHLAAAGVHGVILGPGDPAQSHQADEFVRVDAVRAGMVAYTRIAEEFFR